MLKLSIEEFICYRSSANVDFFELLFSQADWRVMALASII